MSPLISRPRPLSSLSVRGSRTDNRAHLQTRESPPETEAQRPEGLRPEAGSLERWLDMNA